jgi:uncharacterized protein (TIRG00374 family)
MKLKPGNLIKIGVSLGLLTLVIATVGAENLLDALRGVDLRWFLAAIAIHLVGMGIRAYRWWLLIAALGAPVPFGRLLYLYFVGNFFNTFLPTGIGGDVVKIIELAPDRGGANAFSTVFADRLTGVLGSSLIALVVALIDPADVPQDVLMTVVIVSGGILIGVLVLTQGRRLEQVGDWSRLLQRPFVGKLHKVYIALTSYSIGAIVRSTLVSLPFTVTLIATQYLLSIALGTAIDPRYFILFTPIIALTQLLPISFNGLGVREGAFGVLFGSVGVAGPDAVALSLLYYVVRVLTGLFGGVLYIIGNLRNQKANRRNGEPAKRSSADSPALTLKQDIANTHDSD